MLLKEKKNNLLAYTTVYDTDLYVSHISCDGRRGPVPEQRLAPVRLSQNSGRTEIVTRWRVDKVGMGSTC